MANGQSSPLLDLYTKQPSESSPMLSLYGGEGHMPQYDLGDRPTVKPQTFEDLPHPHGVPRLTVSPMNAPAVTEGQIAKEGQTVPQTDVRKDIEQTRQTAVQAGAEVTGVADLRRLYSGEESWTEAAGAILPALAVKDILSPASTALGREAALGLRKATGLAARTTEQTRAALLPYEQKILSLPPQQRLDLIGYMEGRSKTKVDLVDPELQNFADQFRAEMQDRSSRIQSQGIEAGVVEDYVTHLWKDPNKAAQFVRDFQSKQGTGRFLKERTVPTIEEGIKAGLEPVTDNPVEIAMRYVTSMDRHLALREFINAGESAGTIVSDAASVPDDYVRLKGMVEQQRLYAPAQWANVWNNFVSKGVYRSAPLGQAYQGFRNLSNLTTQTILSFSGYHAMAMAKEAIASDLVKGVGQVAGGIRRGSATQLLRGAKTIGKAPAAPVTKYLKGKKFRDVYLGRLPNAKMADVFAEAGGRGVGKAHAFDYTFANAGSFATAWKRGWLKAEKAQAPGTFTKAFKDAAQEVRNAGGSVSAAAKAGHKAMETARQTTQIISRTMSTVMSPLFEEYIPMLKNGAFADEFASWLEMNPNASHEQQVQYAAKLIDSIDNRFGEMIHDNIMWHTLLKQAATIGMLSYSWNLGSLRAYSGAIDIAKTGGKALDPTSPKYSANAGWIVAYPMAMAVMNGVYQYLKTGKPPQSATDLIFPQTGGTAPGFGQRGQVPERGITPGYEKEPFGWYYNGYHEAINKANPFLRMGVQAIMNSNWRDDPIRRPDPTVPEWLSDYFTYVLGSMEPISAGRMIQGEKPGSAMGVTEQVMGIRPAPMYAMDPKGYQRGMMQMETTKWIKKIEHDVKAGIKTPTEGAAMIREAKQRMIKYGGPQQ